MSTNKYIVIHGPGSVAMVATDVSIIDIAWEGNWVKYENIEKLNTSKPRGYILLRKE